MPCEIGGRGRSRRQEFRALRGRDATRDHMSERNDPVPCGVFCKRYYLPWGCGSCRSPSSGIGASIAKRAAQNRKTIKREAEAGIPARAYVGYGAQSWVHSRQLYGMKDLLVEANARQMLSVPFLLRCAGLSLTVLACARLRSLFDV